jgi:hypothetical protein
MKYAFHYKGLRIIVLSGFLVRICPFNLLPLEGLEDYLEEESCLQQNDLPRNNLLFPDESEILSLEPSSAPVSSLLGDEALYH